MKVLTILILLAAAFILLAAVAFAQPAVSQQGATSIAAPADVASAPPDATKTNSGLATKVLQPGTGNEHPGKDEVVVVEYTGWTADGKTFDTTAARGGAGTLTLNRVLPGLSEGVQLMVVGETRRLWVPESLAFKGQKGKPAGPLVFDVTLLDMPLRAPADVSKHPDDAERTATGIYYKVLRPGAGKHHPTKADEVTVNYTGWTTDGKMFDSSFLSGGPKTLPLDTVIRGWSEGMGLMVEGEKTRFWIPEKLAYQGRRPPYGTLVFDIELIRIR